MASFNYCQLRADATQALQNAAYSPRKLVLIHTAVSAAVALVLSVLSYVLELGIAETGGLGGIGTRTVLETMQQILQLGNAILLPFWSIGYVFAILQLSRQESADARSLLSGFRCFGPVLRTMVLQGVIYFAVIMAASQIIGAIYLMTPMAAPMYELMEQLAAEGITDPYAIMESEAYLDAAMDFAPFVLIGALILLLPVVYRLRFMEFALMDDPQRGAFHALAKSLRLTKRKCFTLFKLDLRFWWYYALELLISLLCYGDVLLPMLGVEMAMGADTAMFVFQIAALVCQLALYVWKQNQVFVTYALVYDELHDPQPEPVKPAPTNLPWKY